MENITQPQKNSTPIAEMLDSQIEALLKTFAVYIWLCPNGHYVALSSQGKFPPGHGMSGAKNLREAQYKRRKARGDHNHEQCPHCPIGVERKIYLVKQVAVI